MMPNAVKCTAGWDAGDSYVHELWHKTREWSLEEFRDILRMLDIKMDVWFFESEADKPAKEIVEELIAKGIAEDERPQGGAGDRQDRRETGINQRKISHERSSCAEMGRHYISPKIWRWPK